MIAFRSHWRYQSEYCNPASGNEKGGVEGELGWFRRNCLVPVPEAADLVAFNEQLLTMCKSNRARTIIGHAQTIGEASCYEQTYLNPLAKEGYPIAEILFPLIVDSQRRVRVKTNWYSAPLSPGLPVTAEVSPLVVSIHHDGHQVAEHARGQQILNLEHYLDVLERKPGAMATGGALASLSGPTLAAFGGPAREEPRHARDDHAHPRRHGQWLVHTGQECGASVEFGHLRYRRRCSPPR